MDDDIFAQAMRGVQPLQGKGRAVGIVAPDVHTTPRAALNMQVLCNNRLQFALSHMGEYVEGHVVGLDAIIMNKLRAGQFRPEARMDLHGFHAKQAYQTLVGFFRSAWYKGVCTVLVVPGRGKNSPDGIGVLRDKLQYWFTQEPFKRVVLAFCTARPADGGPGSVYVLLRKIRKKREIYWECMPQDPDLY